MPVENTPQSNAPVSRRVRLGDLVGQYQTMRPEIDAAVSSVLNGGAFVLGPEVRALEQEIATRCGVAYGIGVNSGTDAILLSLLALDIGPGDEVITSPFTFFATAETISVTGAKPVFADIDPNTFNIDPAAVEAALTPRTKAIVPVHLYGQAADMEPLKATAARYGLAIVEDAAQAIGASCHGKPCGSFGDLAAFSFYPTKNLGAFGDGGMVVTNDESLMEKVRLLRAHGSGGSYFYKRLGYCSRLDEIQAAILRVKLGYLDRWNESRRQHAALYNKSLQGSSVQTPQERNGCYHIYHQYTIRCERRDELKTHLASHGIDSGIYYPLPLHLQEVYQELGYQEGDLPNAEQASRQVLSLPVYPELTADDIAYVASRIQAF